MHLDDRLDALLTASGQPATALPDDDDTRALAPLLAAAVRLAPLREARPAARFADQLERELLARAAAYAPSGSVPVSAAAVADRVVDGDAPMFLPVRGSATAGSGDAPTLPAGTAAAWPRPNRTPSTARGRQMGRGVALPVWGRALVAACVLLVLGSGLFAVGANAQPGSPLFGLHRAEQWAQVSLASPADKARLHLQYAGDALAALNRAVAQRSGDPAYASALDTLRSELSAAAATIAALPAGQTHDTLAAQLAALQQRTRVDLRAALPGLGWNDRVGTTAVLGGLGEAVPRITGATIHQIAGQGGHAVQVVVSGSGFVTGARLVIAGQPAGMVVSVSDGTLVALMSFGSGVGRVVSIGVENPDGTAAQTDAADHGAAITPTPAATPTAHHGHGGHGGH